MRKPVIAFAAALVVTLVGCAGQDVGPVGDEGDKNAAKTEQQPEMQKPKQQEAEGRDLVLDGLTVTYPEGWEMETKDGRAPSVTVINPDSTCMAVITSEEVDVPREAPEASDLVTFDAAYAKYEGVGLLFPDGHDRESKEGAEFERSRFQVETEYGVQQGYLLLIVAEDRMYSVICSTYGDGFDEVMQGIVDSATLNA